MVERAESVPVYRQPETLVALRDVLAQAVAAKKIDSRSRVSCAHECRRHLAYLEEAVAASAPLLFEDYLSWAKVAQSGNGLPAQELRWQLVQLRDELRSRIDGEVGASSAELVDRGVAVLEDASPPLDDASSMGEPSEDLAHAYLRALLATDRRTATRLVLDALDSGVGIQQLYLEVFQPCQFEIGRQWQRGAISVAEEHFCTAVTQSIMAHIYERQVVFESPRNGRCAVVFAVGGELHELGPRMLADFFELSGWDTLYFGASNPASSVARLAREKRADVVGLSATMTFHLSSLHAAIRELRARGAVRIMVGGRPFRLLPDLWQRLGADGSAKDALGAVELATRLLER